MFGGDAMAAWGLTHPQQIAGSVAALAALTLGILLVRWGGWRSR